jgi:hypothetical protein
MNREKIDLDLRDEALAKLSKRFKMDEVACVRH